MFCNILVTGTPGVGKTTFAEELAKSLQFTHINSTQLIKEHNFLESYDEKLDTHVLDEDKYLDELETIFGDSCSESHILDSHYCGLYPERWFQLVIVLRTDSDELAKRLQARNYNDLKLKENLEAEIFQVISDDAKESYKSDIILELPSNTTDDIENNIEKVTAWLREKY